MNRRFLHNTKFSSLFVAMVCLLVFTFFIVYPASADEWTFADNFKLREPGSLNGQGGWNVINYYGNSDNTVDVSSINSDGGSKYVEISNDDSLVVSHSIAPVNAGAFQFRMKHNKSGLFYFYALTSDELGQLLFSIQFTESNGILLEEGKKQITLLKEYNAGQWYLFTIDFDSKRGERGTFKVKIDNNDYGEYEYVNSESTIFDFAQMVFGSDSNGKAISAFGDIAPASFVPAITTSIDDTAPSSITTAYIDGVGVVTTTPDATPMADVPSDSVDLVGTPAIAPQLSALQEVINSILALTITQQAPDPSSQESITAPSPTENSEDNQIITAPF